MKYYETLTEERREKLFAFMRAADAEAEQLMCGARRMEGNGTSLPVGAGHFDDYLLPSVVRHALLGALRAGATPEQAIEAARQGARECVKTHNARRPKQLDWQRWEGSGQTICDGLEARLARVLS